ncbi:excinuclease ABC subunit UvrA [Acetivibrio mesophilus]|uniref:UvrABC system protein A n=1 Tax=Acetivibrio mesophilus TaxID=2487273 RepID=A0A4V1K2L3_9FIRM|nr:excinuclease ABC subunit UvrA [Acetivibrio mesophilus]ODM26258.1 excinuclease ABC subunit A [Clostridium sp. Bc-iso-3]RXE60689.1 excinuclease ABC subunit A [Acetivibrio mesophilus]HHV28102.1 excinuclease ABC subunit UvrA [Clostridium sp.]
MNDYIIIKGAKENNLKNISLSIPKNKLVVLTGLSGSGKSTLAFDTLQKECQRQYMESMGMVTDFISKPNVDAIIGLSPSISVDQYVSNRNPRSTVGTVTEVFTYLRILFAKLGQRPCPKCGEIISPKFEVSENANTDMWDGELNEGIVINSDEAVGENEGSTEEFGNTIQCSNCGELLPELTMSHFSFNRPDGACPECTGLGVTSTPNISMIINEDLSIKDGAVEGWYDYHKAKYLDVLKSAAKHYGFSFDEDAPIKEYTQVQKDLLLYGVSSSQFRRHYPKVKPPNSIANGRFEGVITALMRRYAESANDTSSREKIEKMLIQKVCPSCNGTRLKEESRKVTVAGKSIIDISNLSLFQLSEWVASLPKFISSEGMNICLPIISDLSERLKRLINVGVGYLKMERSASTLSAGESQRLRLASLLGSGLTGVLYVLDEPTVGLHAIDTKRLITVMRQLRDLGNTVLVIEHDVEIMRAADYIIDIGPGAGKNGGEVVAIGAPEEVGKNKNSITGRHLSGVDFIQIPSSRRKGNGKYISITNAYEHNLKNISVDIPLGMLAVLSGVSGSGKSTLMFDIIGRAAEIHFSNMDKVLCKCDSVNGLEYINNVITIDQSPIGRTPRSNAATYTDVFKSIRNLYAELSETKIKGIQAKHFSFNVPGGRCEKCKGAGVLSISMHFLPNVQVRCPACHGRRFKREILNIKYNGYSISDVLDMSIQEAVSVFKDIKPIYEKMSLMEEVGLGYLQLGQAATTLSGGEAQRVKLAKELSKNKKGHTLYLLDEPTTGLHPHDVHKLIPLLQRLVEAGNTVVVIEHNLDVISVADWIIDFGPEGGDAGGEIVAQGTPEQVAKVTESKTGFCLKEIFSY